MLRIVCAFFVQLHPHASLNTAARVSVDQKYVDTIAEAIAEAVGVVMSELSAESRIRAFKALNEIHDRYEQEAEDSGAGNRTVATPGSPEWESPEWNASYVVQRILVKYTKTIVDRSLKDE